MGEINLKKLIASMQPRLNLGRYVFCTAQKLPIDISDLLLIFKESEGFTIVCTVETARLHHWTFEGIFSWITLDVHSALEAVGLTAAFSKTLAENNISCNVVAGFYHDHIFVPEQQAESAMEVLKKLSEN